MDEAAGEEAGDPCHSYTWSILFCIVMTLALLAWAVALALVYRAQRRSCSTAGWVERASVILAVASLAQFGPMLASSLHSGHNVYSYSQTGCKLLFYTEYGMRHVITSLVVSLLAWAYWVTHHGLDSAEGLVRRLGTGYIILGLALVQGLFGMVPAMYVDLAPDRQSCIWTSSMWLTLSHVVSMEVILRPITPYLIPGLLAIPVIVHLARALPSVEQETRKEKLKTVLAIVASYFLLNLPYAVNLLAEYGVQLNTENSFATICNLKWFFFLIHQSWFLLTPLLLVLREPSIELPSPSILIGKLKRVYEDKARLI